MSVDILDKIERSLREQQVPVSALEIAQRFLSIDNAIPEIAEKIVAGLLGSQSRFFKDKNGLWTVLQNGPAMESLTFIICQIFPERTVFFKPFSILLAKFKNNDFIDDISYTVKPESSHIVSEKVKAWIGEAPILFSGFGNQLSNFRLLMQPIASEMNPTLSLVNILKRIMPDSSLTSASDVSKALSQVYHDDNGEACFSSFKLQTQRVIELLCEQNIKSLTELHHFMTSEVDDVNFDAYAFDDHFITEMTRSAGVYIMKDNTEQVIYVGKAKNLRRRLLSYFSKIDKTDEKRATIREQLYDIEIIETGSELEALLKEYELINTFNPPINRQFDVHPRTGYTRERYPRILFLPSADENIVNLFFYNPTGRVKMIAVDKGAIHQQRLKCELEEVFSDIQAGHSSEIEIITSWLTHNADVVNSIDMRTVTAVDEAIRLIELNVKNFDPDQRAVYQ